MINIEDEKVKEVLEGIHEAMLRKRKRGSNVKEEIVMENQIFSLICNDHDMGPTGCARVLHEKYGYDLTGDQVVAVFRSRRMANPHERRELLEWAQELAGYFEKAIAGDRDGFDRFEKLRKEPCLKNGKKHDSQERIAAIMIYEKHPEIDLFDDSDSLRFLGNTLARYFFYDMADAVAYVYGFPQFHGEKKKTQSNTEKKKMTHEQALQRVQHLELALDRANIMLQDLQDEFEEQLESSKIRELADFFVRLNSEKYGCILDELLVVRKGVDKLRKSDYQLPMEIDGLLIMVKKLIQFVRDSHIEPVMKIQAVQEVTAADVEFCSYEGTAFASPKERKRVRVISPGWVYKDKELQISRPKVKEEA